jgi:hypothetical protein
MAARHYKLIPDGKDVKEVHVEEEIYTQEYLWRSAKKLLSQAEAEEEGSYFYLLPSLLMSFLVFEAFVNFCGYVLTSRLVENDEQNFKTKGIEGKIIKIVAELEIFAWEKGKPHTGR